MSLHRPMEDVSETWSCCKWQRLQNSHMVGCVISRPCCRVRGNQFTQPSLFLHITVMLRFDCQIYKLTCWHFNFNLGSFPRSLVFGFLLFNRLWNFFERFHLNEWPQIACAARQDLWYIYEPFSWTCNLTPHPGVKSRKYSTLESFR